ncbi:putative methyltransferase [Tanacetum coccineum]
MAGLFDKQAEEYLDARPTYPAEWDSMLADRTSCHSLAWDVGIGNGQAAIGEAEHYKQVIGTDISEPQLKLAKPHPRVRFYSVINRVLKQHGVFAMWGYNDFDITPDIDAALKRFHDTTFPYWKEDINYLMVIHKELSFESVGLGSEGSPLKLDIPKKLAFDGVLELEVYGAGPSWLGVLCTRVLCLQANPAPDLNLNVV